MCVGIDGIVNFTGVCRSSTVIVFLCSSDEHTPVEEIKGGSSDSSSEG